MKIFIIGISEEAGFRLARLLTARGDEVDGEGVTKAIEAAHEARVRRFILVSVFPDAWRARHMDASFEHYVAVKKQSEIELVASGFDWVILRPSALTSEEGVRTVSLSAAEPHTEVRRDDVAATLAELIHTPTVRHWILEPTEGATPISAAVAAQVS